MQVICNTTPFIALAAVNEIRLLQQIYTSVIVPEAVVEELKVGGAIQTPNLTELEWIRIVPNVTTVEDRLLFQLDYGERHVILNALQLKADLVLIDDRVARNIAEYLGIQVKGTLGVLIEAKRQGFIGSFRQIAFAMQAQGIRFSSRLIEELAKAINE
ncbi:hypothetical protein U27_04285 [Candidatus Vecturithrix granuli]|uniref:DUF3368 domain-containing protein n=1 Tax=Vecturithrix granuli TaxID=1499967 RepID=A0A081BYB5_VECG1|nr:hypothetical protein U27_04285 [Candidatus Vecturithrix granuli]